ncbi:chaperone modulator CbpM [Neolewinella lacunae]|uniref:Uncharacterized protein n=1 Tax=Neolewinella lacunae TaxID=1517758 RepID=A0A923TAI4_9BACT|nr:chaperone modulator CbpM [Neolewinella lacunae]MBC6996208.1 hypothetical protein [Neolewinella lacunae]MDN3637165.1 chaperone modulator CbpM [Neolewinella lacunae]
MSSITYVTLQQFCSFHQCETLILEDFLDHGIIRVERQNDIVLIPEPELPKLEKALRLHLDLGVNAAGIDIILNLLERMEGVME